MVFKGCFYVRASLCRLCGKSNIFGADALFVIDACHVFHQNVLAIIPLIGDVYVAVVMRAYTGCWWCLHFALWLLTALLMQGLLPGCSNRGPSIRF